MPDLPYIRAANHQNFTELVLQNSYKGPVLVDYWAPMIGPCAQQQKLFEGLAQQFQGKFLLVTVNTDQNKRLASEQEIRSLPQSCLYRYGELVLRFRGLRGQAEYQQALQRYAVTESDQKHADALRLFKSGDIDSALKLLADASVSAPENIWIPLSMAKILYQQKRFQEAKRLMAAIPENLHNSQQYQILSQHLSLIDDEQ